MALFIQGHPNGFNLVTLSKGTDPTKITQWVLVVSALLWIWRGDTIQHTLVGRPVVPSTVKESFLPIPSCCLWLPSYPCMQNVLIFQHTHKYHLYQELCTLPLVVFPPWASWSLSVHTYLCHWRFVSWVNLVKPERMLQTNHNNDTEWMLVEIKPRLSFWWPSAEWGSDWVCWRAMFWNLD